jgi:hypothetical protein
VPPQPARSSPITSTASPVPCGERRIDNVAGSFEPGQGNVSTRASTAAAPVALLAAASFEAYRPVSQHPKDHDLRLEDFVYPKALLRVRVTLGAR